MVSVLAVLIMLATVFAVMLGGHGHGYRPGLAKTRMRKASGPNSGSVLAVIGIAGLVLELGNLSFVSGVPGVAPLLVALAVVLIIGVVVGRSVTEIILSILGIGLLVLSVGVSGALTLAILAGLMLWLLGAVRGWMG